MPELPEVETILQGIRPHVIDQTIRGVIIRQPKLRWQIPNDLIVKLKDQPIVAVSRRGKYLLFSTPSGTAILHLGMSGSLSLLSEPKTPSKHDHFDLIFDKFYLRYTDPRRFGAFLYTDTDPQKHPLLASLGIEPLAQEFTGKYLFTHSRNRKIPIKQLIMNHKIVVGVGNIYAAESLFLAKIHPLTPANTVSQTRYQDLAKAIRKVLLAAIKKGGTTLKDFKDSQGRSGYFKQKLNVYGRGGQSCYVCHYQLTEVRLQNRSTVFCIKCQN